MISDPANWSAGNWLEHGRNCEDAGRFGDAERAYHEALARDQATAEHHYRLGCVLRKTSRISEAADSFRRAAELDVHSARSWTNLGAALDDLGRREEAADMYGRAIRAGGDVCQAHNNLGALYADEGRTKEALRCFQAAIEARPDVEGYLNIGLLHFHASDYEPALENFELASGLAPDHAITHYHAALTLLKKGVSREALTRFRKALQLDERLVRTHFYIGTCLHRLRRFDEALTSLQRALDHLPDDGRVHYQAALTLDALELSLEARRHYRLARGESATLRKD